MNEKTSDIENVEIKIAMDMFSEQCDLLIKEIMEFVRYTNALEITHDFKKYFQAGDIVWKEFDLRVTAYHDTPVEDRPAIDKRALSLVTSCVNDMIELREELKADFTKTRALNEVKPTTDEDTLNVLCNSCCGLVAFMSVIGFFVYLFTR